jgi:phosphatidylglycerophosphatase GEP4
LKEQEEEEESNVVRKWEDKFSGPILGPLIDSQGREIGEREEKKSEKHDHELGGRMRERQYDTGPTGKTDAEMGTSTSVREENTVMMEKKEDLRILVIGDRMMTDTLLANRLAKHLPPSAPASAPISNLSTSASAATSPSPSLVSTTTPLPSVLSIHTTLLHQPKDVRPLRWIEEKLSRGRVREDTTDWARYTTYQPPPPLPVMISWKERINPLRDTPAPTWHPSTWKPASLLVALGLGLRSLGRGIYWVGGRVWEGEVEVAKVMAERAESAKKEAERKEAVAVVVEEVTPKPKI